MLFNGWSEDPQVVHERWERLHGRECTCSPNDDNGATACSACIEQARQEEAK